MRTIKHGIGTALLAAALLSAPPIQRVLTAQNAVVTNMSSQDVEGLLRGMGIEYKVMKEGMYNFRLEGYNVVLFNKGTNMQFWAGFKKKADLQKVNEWNKNKRFSRAYIDGDGDPVVEWDVDFDGGVQKANVENAITTFRAVVVAFTRFLNE